MATVLIDGQTLTIESAYSASIGQSKLVLCHQAIDRMSQSRRVVEEIVNSNQVVYGINTGFGAMSSVKIDETELAKLQTNLIRSHACGVGENMDPEHVLLMMVYRANSLSKGVSGIRPEVVKLLIDMINLGIAPIIPRIGSLGASGDLAPLSHMALGLIGEGSCLVRDRSGWKEYPTSEALIENNLKPVKLQAKEGLSLINGTSQMCTYLSLTLLNLERLLLFADASAACSLEAIRGSHSPFDPRIHNSRPQRGQLISASRIAGFLHDSQVKLSHEDCDRVQDAYCFRCVPQVHGPVIDIAIETRRLLKIEINSATDNPLVFYGKNGSEIISGGNFHGQNLALASDSIAVACHELASIAERRINQVLDPNWGGQSAFLAIDEGLESGYMIVQYVAAACIAELHLLSNPVTTSNVPVSMGKEDHVSMGATGTFRSLKSTTLLSQVIANELVCSIESLERLSIQPGNGVVNLKKFVRKYVEPFEGDRVMSQECQSLANSMLLVDPHEIFG